MRIGLEAGIYKEVQLRLEPVSLRKCRRQKLHGTAQWRLMKSDKMPWGRLIGICTVKRRSLVDVVL